MMWMLWTNIVSADGTRFMAPVLAGQRPIDRRSNLVWPEQQRPPPSDWSEWYSAPSLLCIGTTLIKPILLCQGHGHQSWFWHIDSTRTLYNYDSRNWQSFPPSHSQSAPLENLVYPTKNQLPLPLIAQTNLYLGLVWNYPNQSFH